MNREEKESVYAWEYDEDDDAWYLNGEVDA